jgi:HK97 family phage prohead protease
MPEIDYTFTAEIDALEVRTVADRHVLEGICVPYGAVTTKAGPVPEQFAAGAFAELVASRAPVKLTDYNHSRTRISVGRSASFEERAAGLWGRFQINRTPEGESAFQNLSEGVYGGLSIGFLPVREEQRGGVRTITQARLHHVSLVEEPAYDDAVLLSLRGQSADPIEPWRWIYEPVQRTSIDIEPRKSFTEIMAGIQRR